jgi:integral membrane protein
MPTFNIFRKIAFAEGISYLLFALTMPLKYIFNVPEPNFAVGLAHGVLFVAYCLLLLDVWIRYNWKFKKAFFAFVASLVPFGTFWAEKHLYHKDF